MSERIQVVVIGACGRMGQEVVRTVLGQADMMLVGAADVGASVGRDIGEVATGQPCGVLVQDVAEAFRGGADVLVDFTRGDVAAAHLSLALEAGIACVVGTTGISAADLSALEAVAVRRGTALFLVPNFSLGAVLMMVFSRIAARHFEWAEIIELHHEKKLDAPSGTALRTAEMMLESRSVFAAPPSETLKMPSVRGGLKEGIRLHSVRMPGLLAHQEVMLGAEGEVLTLRHDSTARTSFMPGVALAIRNVKSMKGLVVGLETLIIA